MRPGIGERRAPAAGRGAGRLGGAVRALTAVVLVLAGPQPRGDLGAVDADAYQDAFTTPAAAVSRLHVTHRKVICYLNAGAYEDWRPDANRFPADVLGAPLGVPGERWLDIRRWDALAPILTDRLELCRHKGFDAVEVANVDAYARVSGFPLTGLDQLT